MPECRTGRAAAALACGLLLGIAGGWLAGLLRVPKPVQPAPGAPR